MSYLKSKREHDELLPDLKQTAATGFAFNCSGAAGNLRTEVRREANWDELGASHLRVTAMLREGRAAL